MKKAFKRSFSGVFNIYVNQWCVKHDENLFTCISAPTFPKIREIFVTHAKKCNFKHSCKTKMLQIIVFWSNHKIKIL